jgi:hypothetical protein
MGDFCNCFCVSYIVLITIRSSISVNPKVLVCSCPVPRVRLCDTEQDAIFPQVTFKVTNCKVKENA